MDPVTALGLALNICQAVELGVKLVQACADIEAGKDEYTTLRNQSDELSQCCEKLRESANGGSRSRTSEEQLLQLCSKCQTASQDLQEEIKKYVAPSGPGRRRSLVRAAFRSTFNTSKIDRLQRELQGYRETLQTRVLVELRSQNVISQKNLSHISNVIRTNGAVLQDLQLAQLELEETARREAQTTRALVSEEARTIRDEVRTLNIPNQRDRQEALLQSLYFPELNTRREEVTPAHHKTFRWVLSSEGHDGQKSLEFRDWLEHGNGVFWLNGKPGSGKSTLMRFVLENDRTAASLRAWSRTDVLILSFFFWKPAGERLENTIIGFQRALLYQILENRPEHQQHLLDALSPKPLSNSSCQPRAALLPQWSITNTWKFLQRVLSVLSSKDSTKVCIFVDGLDEFDGPANDLVRIVKDLSNMNDVKVCVSSRPEVEFHHAFSNGPKLKLQDLTDGDIQNIIEESLEESNAEREDGPVSPTGLGVLRDILVDKADGVFLWVSVALASIRLGMINDESFEELEARLHEMPPELADLFAHIISRIPPTYLLEASRYVKLLRACEDADLGPARHVTTVGVALTNIDRHQKDLAQDLGVQDLLRRCRSAEKRVMLRSAGLLELGSRNTFSNLEPVTALQAFNRADTRLRFVHRTAEEFVTSGKHALMPYLSGNNTWNAARELAKSDILRMHYASIIKPAEAIIDEPTRIMRFLRLAESETSLAHTQLVSLFVEKAKSLVAETCAANQHADPPSWEVCLGHADDANVHDDENADDLLADATQRPEFLLYHHAHDELGMCAAWGLEQSVRSSALITPSSATYLLFCATETVSMRLGLLSARNWPGNAQRPLYERWPLMEFLLHKGGDPMAKFRTSKDWLERSLINDANAWPHGWRSRLQMPGLSENRALPAEYSTTASTWSLVLLHLVERLYRTQKTQIRCTWHPGVISESELGMILVIMKTFIESGASANQTVHRRYFLNDFQDCEPLHRAHLVSMVVDAHISVKTVVSISPADVTTKLKINRLLVNHNALRRDEPKTIDFYATSFRSEGNVTLRVQLKNFGIVPCWNCIASNSIKLAKEETELKKRGRKPMCTKTLNFFSEVVHIVTARLPSLLEERVGKEQSDAALADGSWPRLVKDPIQISI